MLPKQSKYKELSPALQNVMDYLDEALAKGSRYISYTDIGKALEKKRSKHAVAYAINRLRQLGYVRVRDGKLSLI